MQFLTWHVSVSFNDEIAGVGKLHRYAHSEHLRIGSNLITASALDSMLSSPKVKTQWADSQMVPFGTKVQSNRWAVSQEAGKG